MNHDELKARTHRYNKLSGDGEPWEPKNVTENLEQKKPQLNPGGQATEKKLRSHKMNSFKSEPS